MATFYELQGLQLKIVNQLRGEIEQLKEQLKEKEDVEEEVVKEKAQETSRIEEGLRDLKECVRKLEEELKTSNEELKTSKEELNTAKKELKRTIEEKQSLADAIVAKDSKHLDQLNQTREELEKSRAKNVLLQEESSRLTNLINHKETKKEMIKQILDSIVGGVDELEQLEFEGDFNPNESETTVGDNNTQNGINRRSVNGTGFLQKLVESDDSSH